MATIKDLRICAKGLNLKGFSSLNKGELEELINKAGGVKTVKTATMEVFAEAPSVKKPEAVKKPKDEPTQAPVAVEKVRKARTKSTWNTFLTDYRASNGGSLKSAMAAKDAYAEYKSKISKTSDDKAPEPK